MNHRRAFLQTVAGVSAAAAAAQAAPQAPESDRQYWVRTMRKVAEPVLANLAAGTLKRNMPVECVTGDVAERRKYTHLEAIGRLLAGIAPWLEAPLDAWSRARPATALCGSGAPGDPHRRGSAFARLPQLPRRVRSRWWIAASWRRRYCARPNELWKKLDSGTQKNVAAALLSSRVITPGQNNWLLFAATVEAALALMGERWDAMRIDYAMRAAPAVVRRRRRVRRRSALPLGLLQQLRHPADAAGRAAQYRVARQDWETLLPDILARARRYAAIQERLISPEGTFPVIGRSITYRTGAFQLLAQMALLGELPAPLTGARVRAALTAVMRRLLEAPGTFDDRRLADDRTVRASAASGRDLHFDRQPVSLRGRVSAPGLRRPTRSGRAPAEDWTSRRIWRGEDAPADHAITG